MRVRVLAWAILVFAAIDLVLLAVAPILGWVAVPEEAATWIIIALAAAFFLALMAMIGAISILATDFPSKVHLHGWDLSCGECGHRPDMALAFCDRCGAGA
jgi:hypothetical protein